MKNLFKQKSNFIKNFAPILTNLTIKNSQINDLAILKNLIKFSKLLILDLSFNQIETIALPLIDTFLSSILYLNLNNNKIRVIHFSLFNLIIILILILRV